ncbi:unspecified product [Leishmania tarentolae]|uniref:Unspecified product n=1 Tax=Leishmania tarentolae TaxID=5689 RepID=A0A640KEG5_LEITA|nr:unspecified product [Leishmania tarentolae]
MRRRSRQQIPAPAQRLKKSERESRRLGSGERCDRSSFAASMRSSMIISSAAHSIFLVAISSPLSLFISISSATPSFALPLSSASQARSSHTVLTYLQSSLWLTDTTSSGSFRPVETMFSLDSIVLKSLG